VFDFAKHNGTKLGADNINFSPTASEVVGNDGKAGPFKPVDRKLLGVCTDDRAVSQGG
jgi:hypothetical protein